MKVSVAFDEHFLQKKIGYVIIDVYPGGINLFFCREPGVAVALLQSKTRINLPDHHIIQSVFYFEHGTLMIYVPQGESSWFSGTGRYIEKRDLEEHIAEGLHQSSVTNVFLRIATKDAADLLESSDKLPRV
ncbi:MAG: hypothetical protein HY617_00050 [Candidatus Sungbacteria bacterium]|nr:hypothetical protein [Candidatus Sungbacteria bacterium]